VSTYFAMFDTDVTTIHPTVPFAWDLISNSISGGYSYVGVFPNSQPESFNESANARNRESGIAHEVGHNFGLWHQSDYDLLGNKINEYSSGYDALHGPIMGVDYAGLVHKWFIGHNSNSPSELQDDLALIASQIRRFEPPGGDGFRYHDNGGTLDTAVPLAVNGSVQSGSGIIERLTDRDAYSFTSSGGTYNLAAVPTLPSGLRARLEVYAADGTLLAASDDGSFNDQQLVMPLPAGTFYAVVSSHGDYGDVGAYDLTVSTLAGAWKTQDIGFVGLAGSADQDPAAGAYTVTGSGDDIGGTSDGFHYAYQRLNGDGSITARVAGLDPTDPSAKAGVMVRDSLAAGARNALMLVTAGNGTAFQYRTATGGNTVSAGTGGLAAPYWMQLVRSGNTLTGYRSPDGVTWTLQGSATIPMGSSVYIGLAVTSHNNTLANAAAFDNVTLTGDLGDPDPVYNDLPAPTGLTLARGDGTGIDLGWDDVKGATGFAVERSANGVDWARIATTGAGVTAYSDTGLTGSQRYFYRVSALDDTGSSVPSDAASLVNRPIAPFNLTVTSWTTSQLILNWRNVSGNIGYRIQRSTDGVNFIPLGKVGTNVPSFTDRGLSSGTTYYYRVFALSPFGDSPSSLVASNHTRTSGPSDDGGPPAGPCPGLFTSSQLMSFASDGDRTAALAVSQQFVPHAVADARVVPATTFASPAHAWPAGQATGYAIPGLAPSTGRDVTDWLFAGSHRQRSVGGSGVWNPDLPEGEPATVPWDGSW
jgi:hypothetical protein